MKKTDEKEGMTAEELIEALQKVDPDMLVEMSVKIGEISYSFQCVSVSTWEQGSPTKFDFVILEGG